MKIRQLTVADIPAALALSDSAGWNQTAEDWRMLLILAPDSCFGIAVDGALASTATLVTYDETLAWLGMVLTHPAHRRQGLSSALLEHTISHADARAIRTIKLDATGQGRPLYEALGFVEEQPIERHVRIGTLATCPVRAINITTDKDALAIGASRDKLLSQLASRSYCSSAGDMFTLARAGSHAAYIGPCLSDSRGLAHAMIRIIMEATPKRKFYWDLLPRNEGAVSIAQSLGFQPLRKLTRMRRGPELPHNDRLIYAIAGFELG